MNVKTAAVAATQPTDDGWFSLLLLLLRGKGREGGGGALRRWWQQQPPAVEGQRGGESEGPGNKTVAGRVSEGQSSSTLKAAKFYLNNSLFHIFF